MLDQAHGQRILSTKNTGAVKKVSSVGYAHHFGKALDAIKAIAQAKSGSGHAKARIVGANAHIAIQGQAQTATHANATDFGQSRLGAIEHAGVSRLSGSVVLVCGVATGATGFKLRNIGTRHKCFFARATEHNDAHFGVLHKGVHGHGQAAPHVVGHGIKFGRVTEHHVPHMPTLKAAQATGVS